MCLQFTNRVPQVHKFGPLGEHDDRLVDLGYTLYLTILVMIFGDLLSRQLSQRTHIRRENCFFNSSLAGFPESSYVQAGTHRKQAPNMVDFDRTLHIRGFLSALINWIEMVRKGWERLFLTLSRDGRAPLQSFISLNPGKYFGMPIARIETSLSGNTN